MKRNNIKNEEIKPIEISHFNRMQNFNFQKFLRKELKEIFFSVYFQFFQYCKKIENDSERAEATSASDLFKEAQYRKRTFTEFAWGFQSPK